MVYASFEPGSLTINLGATGRVDLVGLRGTVRFVLVLPDMTAPT